MPIPAASSPTLADLKAHLNITTTAQDGELQSMLDRAIAAVAREVGPLWTETVTERHDGGSGSILLKRMPVLTVTSAAYADGTPISTAGSYLDTDSGVLYLASTTTSRSGYGGPNVVVTYTSGRETLPADLVLAVLERAAYFWESQRGGGSARPAFPGETSGDDVNASAWGRLQRSKDLARPYMLV